MILKESWAQFATIKQTIPGLKQSDLQQIVVLKPHQTKTSGMRLRYLKTVKLKVQTAAKAFKSKDEQQQPAVAAALAEAAEMSAHAFDKTIMMLLAQA